jgi:bifunctional UDP-N-acetylglucosamine pyrophosphorylase/glucosamine-1-phosphate N-acetyltransferase
MNNSKTLLWPIYNLENLQVLTTFGLQKTQVNASWRLIDLVMNSLRQNINNVSISPQAFISPSAVIEGPVTIESGAKIMEHAKITGPTYIGKNVVVGNCALVRESFISDNCVVGYLVDVARSFIGRSCWFSRVHIADSLLDDEVNLGGGTVIASLRLDHQLVSLKANGEKIQTTRSKLGAIIGRGTQIGANVTIMPGTLIGKNCVVGAGVVIKENIDDNIFCRVEQKLIFHKNVVSYNSDARKKFKEVIDSKVNKKN